MYYTIIACYYCYYAISYVTTITIIACYYCYYAISYVTTITIIASLDTGQRAWGTLFAHALQLPENLVIRITQ